MFISPIPTLTLPCICSAPCGLLTLCHFYSFHLVSAWNDHKIWTCCHFMWPVSLLDSLIFCLFSSILQSAPLVLYVLCLQCCALTIIISPNTVHRLQLCGLNKASMQILCIISFCNWVTWGIVSALRNKWLPGKLEIKLKVKNVSAIVI